MNCPIMLEVKPDGAGWAEIKMHIGKEDYVFTVSYIGEDIHDLIEKVYYLYPNWGHDDHNNKVMEYYDDVEIESTIDGVTAKRTWAGIPWRTELLWNREGTSVKWKLERPATIDDDFDVTITLEVYQQEEESFHTYTVRYKDLCYAVAKGVTDLLIRYGIVGYYESTWMQDINVRHFLQIKGLVLDREIELVSDSQDEQGIFRTRLGQEMDLLIRPMSQERILGMENKLLQDIAEYIEEHYWYSDRQNKIREQFKDVRFSVSVINKESWSERLKNKFDFIFAHMEDTFSQRMWKIIKQKGLSDVEVYKKANLDRRLFSKMRKEKSYKPSKNTAIAIVIALELDKAAADDLLSRAGFALSGVNKDDVIIRYFIEHKQYDINIINEVLDYYGFPILGERKS